MPTFGDLKNEVLQIAGDIDHFSFKQISPEHNDFWDKMNRIEFKRGYVPGEYEKEGTPALCEMELLSNKEYAEWLTEFKELHKKYNKK